MREIQKKYEFSVSQDVLWDSVTVYEILVHWLADDVRGRPKQGQEFSWTWKLGVEGEFTTKGIYEYIDFGKTIVLRWVDHPAGDIFLRLDVNHLGPNQSELIITNGGFPDSSHFDLWLEGAEAGWDSQVENLRKFLGKHPNPKEEFVTKK